MSKEQVFQLFSEAAQKEELKEKLKAVDSHEELVNLGQTEGLEFSESHVNEAFAELQKQPGFFSKLAEAAIAIFSPAHDDYPAIGVQPFTGDTNQ